MKNLLILFLLFSLYLPTQASAFECVNLHLAYQKEKVGKKAIKQFLKEKMKSKEGLWNLLWIYIIVFWLITGLIFLLFAWKAWILVIVWLSPFLLMILFGA